MVARRIPHVLKQGLIGLLFSVVALLPGNPTLARELAEPDSPSTVLPGDSLAPALANPGGPFSNSVAYRPASNAYEFDYAGSHQVRYTLDLDESAVQTARLRVAVQLNGQPAGYPLAGAGPRYRRTNGAVLEPAELAGQASIQLSSHALVSNTVTLHYVLTIDSRVHHLCYTLWLRGGVLTWQVVDSDTQRPESGNFWGFRIGPSEATPNARVILMPYLVEPIVTYGPGWYYSTYLDRGKSSGFHFDRQSGWINPGQVSAHSLVEPKPDSAHEIEPLNETGYLAASPTLADILPRPEHDPSPYRADLSRRITVDLWHMPGKWHTLWPRDAVRAWASPVSGPVQVAVRAADEDPGAGDGVVVSVRRNDLELWTRVIPNAGAPASTQLALNLQAGERLYFHTNNHNADNSNDATRWSIVITTTAGVYNAAQDWSSVQGQRGWYYLEDRGAAGYAEMVWTTSGTDSYWQGSSPYSHLYDWGAHPGQRIDTDTFARHEGLLRDFERYGLTDLTVLMHQWQRFGYDVKLPDHYPANEAWGGSVPLRSLMRYAVASGRLIALHENYVDHYPDAPSYNLANVALNAGLAPEECWYNSTTQVRAHCTANDKALAVAAVQGQQIAADYQPNAGYEDVDTAWEPRWIDLNANNPTPHSLAAAVDLRKLFFRHQQAQYAGPLFGEGGDGSDRYDAYYAGYVDGVEAQVEGRAGAPFMPDFALRALAPLQVNQGMGYLDRYFLPEIVTSTYTTFDAIDQDRYRVQQIAYGHSGWLSTLGENRWLRPTLEATLAEYYLMHDLQDRYLSSPIRDVYYLTNTTWLDLGQALVANVDVYNPRMRLVYADNTQIMLNGAGQRGWYASRHDYGLAQREHQWRYRYWEDNAYHDFDLDWAGRTWQGPYTYCRIGYGYAHPDTCEPALTWTSTVAASVNVRAWFGDQDATGGDGVEVSIWRNGDRLWFQNILNGDPITYTPALTVNVVPGDNLIFRVSQKTNSANDRTRLDVWLSYTDPADRSWVVPSPGPALTLPASGWVAWNDAAGYLAYTARQPDGGVVDYSQSARYTFARSRDHALRTIGQVATDGTVALLAPLGSGGRSLYAAGLTRLSLANQAVLTASQALSLALVYRSSQQVLLTADAYPAGQLYTVQYAGLPASWRAADGTLSGVILARNLTAAGTPGSPVAWNSPDRRTLVLALRSGQSVLIERFTLNQYLPLHVYNR